VALDAANVLGVATDARQADPADDPPEFLECLVGIHQALLTVPHEGHPDLLGGFR
jgi:hypothetical protein